MRFLQKFQGVDAWLTALTVVLGFCALGNLDRRAEYRPPYDGVVWADAEEGVQAAQVDPDGPADRAGVAEGDLLLSINDRTVTHSAVYGSAVWPS